MKSSRTPEKLLEASYSLLHSVLEKQQNKDKLAPEPLCRKELHDNRKTNEPLNPEIHENPDTRNKRTHDYMMFRRFDFSIEKLDFY